MDVRHDEGLKEPVSNGIWPEESLARVPYWVYQDEANYKREMERLFEAATWNFVCLEADIPNKGDYRTNHVGIMPVIAVRAADGSINCFENRCSHRGALIAFDDSGNVGNQFRCVYHSWSYDLAGNLRGIAFERGINGVGGMPKDFCREDFSPRKLRTTTLCGLVFATLSPDTPPIEEYIGAEVLPRLKRVLNRPIRAAPAQQLEALYREREGHLSRLDPAHLPHDLPHLAPDPGRRRAGERRRRQPFELHHRHARRRQRKCLQGAADTLRPGRPLRARRSQRA